MQCLTTLRKLPANPLESPVTLLLDDWDSVHRSEEVMLLLLVLNVGLKKQAVHFCDQERSSEQILAVNVYRFPLWK